MRPSQILGLGALLGCLFVVGVLFSGFVVSFVGAPQWIPLPWSDFNDFAESRDGKVFVDLGFYSRVLCYGEDGRLLASYPYPVRGGKDVGLATDREGHVFFRTQNSLYVYDTSWRLLDRDEGEYNSGRHWKLDDDGEAVFDGTLKRPAPVVDTLAEPGDYIFSKDRQRVLFVSGDGSRLVRKGNHLERRKRGKSTVRYASPWVLYPFTFPWPATLGLPVTILLAFVAHRCKEKEKKRLPRDLLDSMIRRRRQSIVATLRKKRGE